MYGNNVKRVGMRSGMAMPHDAAHYARATSPYDADRVFGYAPHQYGAIHYGSGHYGAAKEPCIAEGAIGEPVTKLQGLLKDWAANQVGPGLGLADLQAMLDGEPGTFGPITKAVVLDYQTQNGLSMVDGIVGPQTWGTFGLEGVSCGGGGSGVRKGETGLIAPPWYLNPWYWGGITVGAITLWWGISAMGKKGKTKKNPSLFSSPITYIMGDYPTKKRKKSRGRRK